MAESSKHDGRYSDGQPALDWPHQRPNAGRVFEDQYALMSERVISACASSKQGSRLTRMPPSCVARRFAAPTRRRT